MVLGGKLVRLKSLPKIVNLVYVYQVMQHPADLNSHQKLCDVYTNFKITDAQTIVVAS